MNRKHKSSFSVFRFAVKVFLTLLPLITAHILIGPIFYNSISYEWVRVVYPESGFAFQYPEKWSYQLFGDSGFRGFREAKARLTDHIFFGPTVTIVVMPRNNDISESFFEWHAIRWETQVPLIEVNINGITAWRGQRYYETGALKELVYFERENDFIVVMVDGDVQDIEGARGNIEEFINRFEPYGR